MFQLPLWAISVMIVLLVLVIVFYWFLLQWKDWVRRYKEWVEKNCRCPAPGGDHPGSEPGFP